MAKQNTTPKSSYTNQSFITVKSTAPAWTKSIPHLFKSHNIWMYGSLVIMLVIGSIIGKTILTRQSIETKATVGKATIRILPSKQTIPPGSTFQVWISADLPVETAQVEITFNPAHLQITDIPQANQTGTIALRLDKNNTQAGTFLLGTLKFSSNTALPDTKTRISIDKSATHITQANALPFVITTEDAEITLNPTRSL